MNCTVPVVLLRKSTFPSDPTFTTTRFGIVSPAEKFRFDTVGAVTPSGYTSAFPPTVGAVTSHSAPPPSPPTTAPHPPPPPPAPPTSSPPPAPSPRPSHSGYPAPAPDSPASAATRSPSNN